MKFKLKGVVSVGLSLVLLLALLVVALPVSATVSEPDVTVDPTSISTASAYTIEFDTMFPLDGGDGGFVSEGDATAEWSTDFAQGGSYSAKLDPGTRDWYDWAGVTVASGVALTDFNTTASTETGVLDVADTYFWYNIEDGVLGQVPIMAFVFEVGDETWKLVLCPPTPTWVTGNGSWQKLTTDFTTAHLSKHSGDVYSDFDGSGWTGAALFEELGWWQLNTNSPIKGMTVDYVEVSVGTKTALVYVDTLTVDTTTYALESSDTITVEFPSGTTVPSSYTAGSILVSNDGGATDTAANTVAMNADTRVVKIAVPSPEGTNTAAHMAVEFTSDAGIINPGTPGTYTLRVKTSEETSWKESDTYTIGIPGMVTRYNDDGNFVGSYNTIKRGLEAVNEDDTLQIGPGTYDEDPTLSVNYITIVATGSATETILKGDLTITGTYATIDGITIKGEATVSGANATFQNCAFTKVSAYSEATLLTNNANTLSVEDCTFDTSAGSKQDTAVVLAAGNSTTFDGCTFTTDEGTVTAQDTAINVTGAQTGLMVKNCTFNGTKGIGYKDASDKATAATVKSNTFDGFEKAFSYDNIHSSSSLTIRGNTITNQAKSTVGAIDIDGADAVVIVGNTIQDSTGYSVHVDAEAVNVTVIGNNFVNNAKGLKNADVDDLNAVNNWWGDESGPAGEGSGTGDKVSTNVTYEPFLTTSISAGTTTTSGSLDAELICGVKVSGLTPSTVEGAAPLIWVSGYTSNPKDVSPTHSALSDGYFDVYVNDQSGTATLKFYASGIDKNTDAYVWSGLENKWVKCSDQGASATGGYVWVTIHALTTPSLGDLSELPFVLVSAPAAAPETFKLTSPEAGAIDMPLTNIPFTWTSVTDATSYKFVLSGNADLSSPVVVKTAVGTAYLFTGDLTDSTAYYWQITAYDADDIVIAKSDVGAFIARVVEAVAPEITVEVEQPEITVTAPPAPEVTVEIPPTAIPPTPLYIWVIIGVGGLLAIAVIILIVRTRRVV